MLNLKFKTGGGRAFWKDIVHAHGWKIQQNIFSGHYRLLDPEDQRYAWGDKNAMLQQLAKTGALPSENSTSECVILIHGLGRLKTYMSKMGDALEKCGYSVIHWYYSSRSCSIDEAAQQLEEVITLNAKYHSAIHFVTHSLGGIVLRRYLARDRCSKLGCSVMLAPPNNGSAVAREILNFPILKTFFGPAGQELQNGEYISSICPTSVENLLIIAGTKSFAVENPTSWLSQKILPKPNDGTVTVEETKLSGEFQLLEVDSAHSFIVKNPAAIQATVAFIKKYSSKAIQPPEVLGSSKAEICHRALRFIVQNPRILKHFQAMSNIKCGTLGGKTWWKTITKFNDWKVQQNMISNHCRILDSKDRRQLWGNEDTVFHALQELIRCNYQTPTTKE